MKKQQRIFFFRQFLCLLMAVHIINVSIDTPDSYSLQLMSGEQQKALSVNKIESFSELVLEDWLGFTNALPENNDPEDNLEEIKIEQDYFFYPGFALAFAPLYWHLPNQAVLRKPTARILMLVQEITPPPPKRVA